MILRKVIFNFLFLLALSSLAGCYTQSWNKDIDDKLRPPFDEKLLAKKYDKQAVLKGHFNGVKDRDGEKYYNYIIPNAFREDGADWLEINIPVSLNSDHAKMRTLANIKANNETVHVTYNNHCKFFEEYSKVYPLADNSDLAYDYPALIAFCLPSYSSGAYIRFGQKMNISNLSRIDDDIKKKLYIKCKGQDYQPLLDVEGKYDIGNNCEWWQWSHIYTTNTYDPIKGIGLNVYRVAGYFITVPKDILTSPFQLLLYWYCSNNSCGGMGP